MDAIDKKLLTLLQKDCKMTTKELSTHLHLSSTAVFERIKKLEKEKIITSYVAKIDREKISKNFIVFCQITLTSQNKETILDFEKEITQFKEIIECYNISGDYDYILKIIVKDVEEYRDFLVNQLSTLQMIQSKHSLFMISEVKNTTLIEL